MSILYPDVSDVLNNRLSQLVKRLIFDSSEDFKGSKFKFEAEPYYFGRFDNNDIVRISQRVEHMMISSYNYQYNHLFGKKFNTFDIPYQQRKVYNMPNVTLDIVINDSNNDVLLGYVLGIENFIDDVKFLHQFKIYDGLNYGFIKKSVIDNNSDVEYDDNYRDDEPLIYPVNDEGIINSAHNYTGETLYFLSLNNKFAGFLFIGDHTLDNIYIQ